MVYNGYYKVMSNIPKMGHLPIPVYVVSCCFMFVCACVASLVETCQSFMELDRAKLAGPCAMQLLLMSKLFARFASDSSTYVFSLKKHKHMERIVKKSSYLLPGNVFVFPWGYTMSNEKRVKLMQLAKFGSKSWALGHVFCPGVFVVETKLKLLYFYIIETYWNILKHIETKTGHCLKCDYLILFWLVVDHTPKEPGPYGRTRRSRAWNEGANLMTGLEATSSHIGRQWNKARVCRDHEACLLPCVCIL